MGIANIPKEEEYYMPLMVADNFVKLFVLPDDSVEQILSDYNTCIDFKYDNSRFHGLRHGIRHIEARPEFPFSNENVRKDEIMDIHRYGQKMVDDHDFYVETMTDRKWGTEDYKGKYEVENMYFLNLLVQICNEANEGDALYENLIDIRKEVGSMEDTIHFLGGRITSVMQEWSILHRWEKFKKVYRFDPELENLFINTHDEIKIPQQLIKMIPFNPVYVEFPKGSFFETDFVGAFINLETATFFDKDFGIMREDLLVNILYLMREESRIGVLDKKISQRTVVTLNKGHFAFSMRMQEDNLFSIHPKEISDMLRAGGFTNLRFERRLVIFLLNALMYLGCKNAEINEKSLELTKDGTKPYAGKTHILMPKLKEVGVMECGFDYGTTIREMKRNNTYHPEDPNEDGADVTDVTGDNKTKKRKAYKPHPVRAHYQHYWTGKGRTTLILNLKAPYYCGTNKRANVSNVVTGL